MRHRLRAILPWALYVALALASFHPQLTRPGVSVAYVGDALESVYIVAWNVHQAFRSPAHLFDANVLHPLPHSLAFTDHRLLPSLLVAPVLWITSNAVLAYNTAILLACLLAAGGARRLAASLGAAPAAAWAAGALYAFHTYQVHEASRLNVIFHGFIPLALGELVLYLKTGERRRAWTTGLFTLLQGLSSNYHLLYATLLLGLVLVGAVLARPRLLARRAAFLLVPGVVCGALFLPVALPYLGVARTYAHERALPQAMGLEHYLSTAPANLVYGPIGAPVRAQQRGPHFVGFLSLALAAVAVAAWASGRGHAEEAPLVPPRVWVPAALGLALLFVAFSLGRNVVWLGRYLAPGPYRLLYHLPGFQLVRIPERLSLVAMLFVALLVARGLTLVSRRTPAAVALLLAALVPIEHLSPRSEVERVPVGRTVPQVYRWLATQDVEALAEVPVRGEGLVREETLDMYFSTFHWKRIIHGYTAYPPVLTRLLRRLAAQFPSEASLQAFGRVGVDTVIVHWGRAPGMDLYRQVPGHGEEKERRFRRLLRLAGLDLYDRIPAAVAEGRIVRQQRFTGDAAHLYDGTADEAYRVLPAPRRPAAAPPEGAMLRDPAWRYRGSGGEAALAADGRMDTEWRLLDPLGGGESFDVDFGKPLDVSGLVLPLRWDTAFPTRMRVEVRDAAGALVPVARFGEGEALALLDELLADPRHAALRFRFEGRGVTGLRLSVEEGGTSFDGWSIPEVQVLARAPVSG
jgi:hypothetical protein